MAQSWHSLSVSQALDRLKTSGKGLTTEQAQKRLKTYGYNRLPQARRFSRLRTLLSQIKSPLVYVLIIAGVVAMLLNDFSDAIVIFVAVLLNTSVGYFQESKANQALKKLRRYLQHTSVVIRNGQEKVVNRASIVPGDIVILRAGDKVPADARIIESYNLEINEAALTGEWAPALKITQKISERISLADRDNMAYMSTIIEGGWGKAVVVQTGIKTEIGKIAHGIKEADEKKTPYQKKLARFSKIISIIILAISLAIFIEGMITNGNFVEIFTTTVAVAVASIPEGLPVAMTVILALGMQRILKRQGLVRRMASAETLGSTSIVLTDKTGTITEAKMAVAGVYAGKKDLLDADGLFSDTLSKDQELAMRIGMVCNESFVENKNLPMADWIVRGRPTEKPLFVAALHAGFNRDDIVKKEPVLDHYKFDSEQKFAATINKGKSKNSMYMVGSPESVISLSSYVQNGSRVEPLLLSEVKKIFHKVDHNTKRGLRVVAVAYKKTEDEKIDILKLEAQKNMVLVGMFVLHDPIRPGMKDIIQTMRQAGMRMVIVTGDHKFTTAAVAEKIGLKIKPNNIMTGEDLEKIGDDELYKRLKNIQIFARVEPKQKLRIAKLWQKRGHVVAMTGDGINDAPSLKQADIGVALNSGTDVAKEVADLILLNNSFSVIEAAIEEGRAIIDNIRKVIVYLLSDSFAEIILVGTSLMMGWPLPLAAAQILWVNLIEDGPMGIALAFEKREKDVMRQKPQDYALKLLNKEMKVLIFIIGLITDAFLLALFYYLLKFSGYELAHIRTVIFGALTIDSLFYIFSCKSLRRNIWHIKLFDNKFLIYSWLFGIAMLVSAIYYFPFQTLLKTVPLGLFDWGLIMIIGVINLVLIEITKYFFIGRRRK